MKLENLYQLFIECNQKISTDTRNIEKGSLFFALKGAHFNGNMFALKAIELGASFAIVDEVIDANDSKIIKVENVLDALQKLANLHRKKFTIPVIGITGSNGKTTSKELIGAVLSKKYSVLITSGNLNNHIGVPLTILKLTKNHQIAIIEMGANKPGDIAELCNIAMPNYGVITNIGKSHIEGFGSIEGVEKTKKEMYQSILTNKGKIFVNVADEVLMKDIPNVSLITYGNNGNIEGKVVTMNPFLVFSWSQHQTLYYSPPIQSQLVGDYNLNNFLLAATIGVYFDLENDQINQSLASYKPSNNRSQITNTEINTVFVDCYNANASSMNVAIKNFSNLKLQNGIVILGDMLELGSISKTEHQNIVTLISELKLNAYFVGDEFFSLKKNNENNFFPTINDLILYLKSNPLHQKTILLKGSRGIKLEVLLSQKVI